MAKAAKTVTPSVNMALLQAIGAGTVTHVSQDEATSVGMALDPPLIEVNRDAVVDGKAQVRLSAAGIAMLANGAAQPTGAPSASPYALISGAVLPPSKRKGGGGSGAPKKYPFDQMEVGSSFFVAAGPNFDPVKKLGSTISSANMRYAEKTGETKVVERTVRGPGNKAVKDAAGNNQRETKTVDVYKQTRKYTIRPVVGGQAYGDWTAPSDGALIGRTA
jgi:hypothetical protein